MDGLWCCNKLSDQTGTALILDKIRLCCPQCLKVPDGSQVFKLDMVILSIVILCIIAMAIYSLLNVIEKKIRY